MLLKGSLRVGCDNNMSSENNAGYDSMMLSKGSLRVSCRKVI